MRFSKTAAITPCGKQKCSKPDTFFFCVLFPPQISLDPLNDEVIKEWEYKCCYIHANTELTLLHAEMMAHRRKSTIELQHQPLQMSSTTAKAT